MKERPIIFNGEMVRAILDGRKTMTRRVIKPQPHTGCDGAVYNPSAFEPDQGWYFKGGGKEKCPYGVPGDRLYVRETCVIIKGDLMHHKTLEAAMAFGPSKDLVFYCATDRIYKGEKKTPSIFMPKKFARIWLEVTDVRVERVQYIIEEDAQAEGCNNDVRMVEYDDGTLDYEGLYAYDRFCDLWNSINAKRGYGWDVNPWVWVVTFTPCSLPSQSQSPEPGL